MVILFMGIAVLGLVLLQNFLYRRFWQEGFSMDMRFSAKEAFEGDNLFLHQDVANKKPLPLPWVLARYQLSKHLVFDDAPEDDAEYKYQSTVFSIMMYQGVRRRLRFNCGKRGFYRLRTVNLTCNNLLHTRRFERTMFFHSDLTVFPRILDYDDELGIIYKTLDAAVLSNSLINPDPFEFKGIREYNPTDPLRNINFKASAVAQELMVNVFAPTASKKLEIVLNLEYYTQYPNFELYEQGIRLAATIATRYINDDVKVSFFTNGKDLYLGEQIQLGGGNSPGHLHSILEALARVDTIFTVAPIAPQLEALTDKEVVYLIISSYCGEDFMEALADMKGRGLDYVVVVPVEKDGEEKPPEETDVLKVWEAL